MKFIHGDKISNFIGFGLMLGLENQTETPWSGSSCGNKLNTWIIIVRNKLYESSRRKPGWRFTAGFEFVIFWTFKIAGIVTRRAYLLR